MKKSKSSCDAIEETKEIIRVSDLFVYTQNSVYIPYNCLHFFKNFDQKWQYFGKI